MNVCGCTGNGKHEHIVEAACVVRTLGPAEACSREPSASAQQCAHLRPHPPKRYAFRSISTRECPERADLKPMPIETQLSCHCASYADGFAGLDAMKPAATRTVHGHHQSNRTASKRRSLVQPFASPECPLMNTQGRAASGHNARALCF